MSAIYKSPTASKEDLRKVFMPKNLREKGSLTMSLGSALSAAFSEAHVEMPTPPPAPKPPTAKRKWRSLPEQEIRWEHELFGSVHIQIDQFKIGKIKEQGTNSWAPVYTLLDKPSWMTFRFKSILNKGVRLLHAKGAEVTDVTTGNIPVLQVDVQWSFEGGKNVPHTRSKDRDNIDLIFLNEDGQFVEIQVSLTSRNKRFWISVQEVYCGQVVRTTYAKADQIEASSIKIDGLAALVAPLYAENAYPGFDYLNTFRVIGTEVVKYALKHGASMPMSRCPVVEWEPEDVALPEKLAKAGYVRGVVKFFNLVIGWGFASLEDGTQCHVHFKNILNADGQSVGSNGEFPVIEPMKLVALKVHKDDQQRTSAVAIRTF